ncbi:hypothetical protein D3C71_1783990 [compost metagenome]
MYQIQPSGSFTPGIAPRMLIMVQASSGSITAHRNGLVRTSAEQNISQPTVGKAQSRLTGSVLRIRPRMRNGCEWVAIAQGLVAPAPAAPNMATTQSTRPTARPMAIAISGANTSAHNALDSTVWVSETGNDFQNSTLRSRRSS